MVGRDGGVVKATEKVEMENARLMAMAGSLSPSLFGAGRLPCRLIDWLTGWLNLCSGFFSLGT
jgi:hypothetical protein